MMIMTVPAMSVVRRVVVVILKRIVMTRTLVLLIHVMMEFATMSSNIAMMKMLVLKINVTNKLESARIPILTATTRTFALLILVIPKPVVLMRR